MRYKDAKQNKLSEVLKNAKIKAVDEDKGLFIYGDTGTGKTYAMHAIAKSKNVPVRNLVSLLIEFRDHMQNGLYHEKLNQLCDCDYLFIDDIGSEKTSEFVIEFLYVIVNRRYENMKRTILSSNLDLKGFEERYGDRILSRITEMCVIVELQGEDKRLN